MTFPRTVRTYDAGEYEQVRYVEVADGVVVRGVFARTDIGTDVKVEESPVIPMYRDEEHKHTVLSRGYMFAWTKRHGRRSPVTRALPLGYTALYNHSADPNCVFVADHDGLFGEVFTLRDVAAGDELTIDYGWSGTAGRFNAVDSCLRPLPGVPVRSAFGGQP